MRAPGWLTPDWVLGVVTGAAIVVTLWILTS